MSESGENTILPNNATFAAMNNRTTVDRTDVKIPPETQNALLDEIDSDRKSGERSTNWRGTLSKLFKNKGAESTAGDTSDENIHRKTSSLGKMFKRGEKKDDKHGEKSSKQNTFSKFLKKLPFKSDQNANAEPTPKGSAPLTAAADY